MSTIDSELLNHFEALAQLGMWVVIVGVTGEGFEIGVKFFRKTWFAKHERKIEFFAGVCWVLVVIGLLLEFYGYYNGKKVSDRENARLTSEAAQAMERATKADIHVEELRKANNEFEALVTPRSIEEYNSSLRLKEFKGVEAKIIASAEGDSVGMARQIHSILLLAGWNVADIVVTTKPVNSGVAAGICHLDPYWGKNADKAEYASIKAASSNLVNVLNDGGVAAEGDPQLTKLMFDGVLIVVGNKPEMQQFRLVQRRNAVERRFAEVQKIIRDQFGHTPVGIPEEFWRLADEQTALDKIHFSTNALGVGINDTNFRKGAILSREVRDEPLP